MRELADYIGCTFRHGGRGPGSFDCWGLVQVIYRDHYGITIPVDNSDIAADAIFRVAKAFRHQMLDTDTWTQLHTPETPSIVIIANHPDHPAFINHCGIYIGAGRFLQCLETPGVVSTRIDDPVWARKIRGFFRYNQGVRNAE
jgi:cell wall-associated NlpC family hydrolase